MLNTLKALCIVWMLLASFMLCIAGIKIADLSKRADLMEIRITAVEHELANCLVTRVDVNG